MTTPQFSAASLAHLLSIAELWIKREDLNISGSHKIRSIRKMIQGYLKKGKKNFVISSSGNAAIAAAFVIRDIPDAHVTIYVAHTIHPHKWKRLLDVIGAHKNISIEKAERAKQSAFLFSQHSEAIYLRGSTDPLATCGYWELADELSEIPNLQAIFIPTSSGVTALGIAEGFIKNKKMIPEIHIVQTSNVHPIASEAPPTKTHIPEEDASLSSAIVDRVAHRKKEVLELIQKSKGGGWIVQNQEILDAIHLGETHLGFSPSPDSALSLAGLSQAVHSGWQPRGAVMCLFTGK